LNYTINLRHIMYSMYSAHWPLMGWNFRYYYISAQCPSCGLGQRHCVFSCLSVYAFLCTYVHPCLPTRRHSLTSLPQAFIQKIIQGKLVAGEWEGSCAGLRLGSHRAEYLSGVWSGSPAKTISIMALSECLNVVVCTVWLRDERCLGKQPIEWV